MSYYPELPEGGLWALEIVLRNAAADPDYLNGVDCPYSGEEIEVLTRLVGVLGVEDEEIDPSETKWDRLERESDTLFRGLTNAGKQLEGKDNAEKMAYFRTATSLLDKIVGIQERIANIRAVAVFHATVMGIIEDEMDAGQRTRVMEKLERAIKQ